MAGHGGPPNVRMQSCAHRTEPDMRIDARIAKRLSNARTISTVLDKRRKTWKTLTLASRIDLRSLCGIFEKATEGLNNLCFVKE